MAALRAWFGGAWRVLTAPAVVVGVYLVTLAITAPLGAMLQRSLPPESIRVTPAVEQPVPPDADWLDEVSSGGRGLLGTLSPAVFGVAAPIDNLGAILDRRGWPLPIVGMIGVFFGAWALMWGGVIARLAHGRGLGIGAAVAAARRAAPGVLALGLAGIVLYVSMFVIVHPILLGPVYGWLSSGVLERTAFLWRAGLTLLFGAGLVMISQLLDFARLAVVLDRARLGVALARGLADLRRQPWSVAGVVIINGLLFAALVAAYGAVEFVPGGSVPRLSRILIVGQAYILARLVLRLVLVAAQIAVRQGPRSGRR